MNEKNRLPKILIACEARIPSVELGAIMPISELQKQGRCLYRYKDQAFLSFDDIAWCDILLIVRGSSARDVMAAERAKNLNRLVLGYWDDDFFTIPRCYDALYTYYTSSQVRENINALFKLSDAFFSHNQKLAAKLSRLHGTEAIFMPGAFWPEDFTPSITGSNTVPIAGFGGSIVHTAIINSLLGPALCAVASSGFNFRLHVIGPKPDFLDRLQIDTVYTPAIANYYEYLAFAANLHWDIGLAPQIDCEFTSYKYHNKMLEYAHIGCAGIYSKLEPYTSVIEDGVTGLLVENEVDAWKEAILSLLTNPELRMRIARNAREYVQSHHNKKVVTEQYAAALGPFLAYRAPRIGKTHIIKQKPSWVLKQPYNRLVAYRQAHGMRGFILHAPKYLLSRIYRKIRH